MNYIESAKKISESPTRASVSQKTESGFDIADLYNEKGSEKKADTSADLSEKLRQAYFWVVNHAIISPYYDIEYNDKPPRVFHVGDLKSELRLPTAQSYSSFVLLPLINLVVRKRCLFVGGPGRGKTASAVLMGLLAGYSMKEVRRAIQHGQPQMTVTDLLGNPIPADMMQARDFSEIKIAWRRWLGMRVKIIDEYNRIPTRTQSALLTVMGDNYAEVLDQIYECPDAAWYLTANDDAGGGTYQVIEALKDRIDVIVKALHFNTRFIRDLLGRIEAGVKPEDIIPEDIIFTEAEINRMNKEIRAVKVPQALMRRIEFFAAQFELFESGADQIEYKTKDSVKLSGADLGSLMSAESGKDKVKDLGSQTLNGLSVRAIMTILTFIKGLAYFRGESEVSLEDIRQIIPFVLHDKLKQHEESPFFEHNNNSVYRVDHISWLRRVFDLSCAEYDRLALDKNDEVKKLEDKFEEGLEGLSEAQTRARLLELERLIEKTAKGAKLYGHTFDDLLKLKYLHQRYQNYLNWLKLTGS